MTMADSPCYILQESEDKLGTENWGTAKQKRCTSQLPSQHWQKLIQALVPLRMVMLMTVRTSGIWYWVAGGSEWSQHRLQSLEGGLEGEGTQQTRGRSKSSLKHAANMAVTSWGWTETERKESGNIIRRWSWMFVLFIIHYFYNEAFVYSLHQWNFWKSNKLNLS